MSRQNSYRSAPPIPGMSNRLLNPYPHTEWHSILRADDDLWVLIDARRVVGQVGDAHDILDALHHMPLVNQLLEPCEPATRSARARRRAVSAGAIDQETLNDILKGLI